MWLEQSRAAGCLPGESSGGDPTPFRARRLPAASGEGAACSKIPLATAPFGALAMAAASLWGSTRIPLFPGQSWPPGDTGQGHGQPLPRLMLEALPGEGTVALCSRSLPADGTGLRAELVLTQPQTGSDPSAHPLPAATGGVWSHEAWKQRAHSPRTPEKSPLIAQRGPAPSSSSSHEQAPRLLLGLDPAPAAPHPLMCFSFGGGGRESENPLCPSQQSLPPQH